MKNYLSIGKAAKMIGVSTQTLRNWEKRGILIPHYRLPGSGERYYTLDQIEQFIRIYLRRCEVQG